MKVAVLDITGKDTGRKVELSNEVFGIEPNEILCEITGEIANDLHHIESRGRRKDLEFELTNIMAVTREVHNFFGDKKAYKDWLKEVHLNYLETGEIWRFKNPNCVFLKMFYAIK